MSSRIVNERRAAPGGRPAREFRWFQTGRRSRAPTDGPSPIAQVAVAVWLVVTALAVAQAAVQYQPHTWIERDARFYTNANITLVEHGSLVQDEFCASWYEGQLGWNHNLDASWSNIALGRDGEHLPKHPILMPILATPLFWAFGVAGTLLFNLLFFGLAGAGAFLFTRRYGSRASAMVATAGLLLATGVRGHAYGYHVDTLILALFALAMALSVARRGWLAGALVGAAVMLRPTSMLWLPSLLLLIADRRDWTTMRRALASGAAMLLVVALSNWWLYGAPWWSGYNRVLVVVAGVPQIADHNSAFSVPLGDGLRALFGGPYGVSHRLTFLAFALPGLFLLARRRPLVALAAVLGLVASVILFAKYVWYGDRFLWPSALFLLPALAATFDGAADRARHLLGWRIPIVAALGASAMVAAHIVSTEIQRGGGTEPLPALMMNPALAGAVALGLARAARNRCERRHALGPFALLAPLVFLLFPGVLDRVAGGGADLYLAAAVALALGSRHRGAALGFAVLAGAAFLMRPVAYPEMEPLLSTRPLERLSEPPGRALIGLLAVSTIGALQLGRRAWVLAPALLLLVGPAASVGQGSWPLFALATLSISVPAAAERGAQLTVDGWLRLGTRGQLGAVAAVSAALLVAGGAARATEGAFHIASYRGVRTAEVHLGEVPCDFLAWEHMNWECATFDRGVHNEVGLSTSQPLHVGGAERGLFLMTTARGMPRTASWRDLSATDAFQLRYAVPDELRGGGTLSVLIDGRERSSIPLPARSDGGLHTRSIPTPELAGRRVSLTLRLTGPGAVLLDGAFETARR